MNLNKMVFKKLEDGNYTLLIKGWEIKATPTKNGEVWEHVELQTMLDTRPVNIKLNEVGVDILASNIINYYELDEMTQAEALDHIVGKEVPAYHETKSTEEGKTYYNWFLCRK